MSNQWRKRQNETNPFLSSQAQESSEKTLEEIAQVNPEFAQRRQQRSNGSSKPSTNPYLDSTLYEAQHEYGPDANSNFMAHHGVRDEHKTHDSNGHHVASHSNGNGHHSEHRRHRRADGHPDHHPMDSNQDHDAKSQCPLNYVRGKLSNLHIADTDTVTVRDDNPYHPANFYTEHKDRATAKELVSNHRKYPKAKVPSKTSRRRQTEDDGQCPPNEVNDALDDMDAFFETVESTEVPRDDGHDPYDHGYFVDAHDAEMDAQVRAQYGYHQDAERDHDLDEALSDGDADGDGDVEEDEVSEHFRQFMADPDAQTPLSPRSTAGGDMNCIEGCERITPSNFGSLQPGDIVSILMENLWTYYKVVSNERNGEDFVAKFESGFASKEESVFIKDGVIAQFVTVWGEQSADQIAICREIVGGDGKEKERVLDIVENGWIKLEEDGFTKLHLVVAFEEASGSGKALLKAMGSDEERIVDLDKCAYKVL